MRRARRPVQIRRRPLVVASMPGINVREMLARQQPEDVLTLGKMTEDLFAGPAGDVVYHTILNLKDLALRTSGNQDADRVLGELNGYDKVLEAFERYILNARALHEHAALKREEDEVLTGIHD